MKKPILAKYVIHAALSGFYGIISGAVIVYCEWKKHRLEQGRDELGGLFLPDALQAEGISIMNTVGTHIVEVICGWLPLIGAVCALAISSLGSLIIMDKHDEPTSSYKGCMAVSTIFLILDTIYIVVMLAIILFVMLNKAK